jgi:PDZ domain
METCGRASSARSLELHWWRRPFSSDTCRGAPPLPVFCALVILSVVGVTAFSVHAGGIVGWAANPTSPAFSGLSTDSSADAVGAPSAAPTPAAGSKTESALGAGGTTPDTTTEIPLAMPGTSGNGAESESVPPPGGAGQQAGPAEYDDGVIRYEHENDADISGPPIGSLDDFMSEGDITSPLGFEVREDKRQLKSGAEAQGLLIVDVFAGSPAARAGLHSYHRTMRDALETAAVAGAMFCPPVVLLVPVFDQVRLGESYDLIIGVDGSRVTNFLDFEERLRDVRAGEIVYFSIVRNGKRMQIPVPVPENIAEPTF